jgi:hypothetical protein
MSLLISISVKGGILNQCNMKSSKKAASILKVAKVEKLRDASLDKSAMTKSGCRVYSGNSGGTRRG